VEAPAFLKAAIDPEQWLSKSAALRRSGNRLWESFLEGWVHVGLHSRAYRKEEADKTWSEALDYLMSSKFLYGLALETSFKAHLLKERPSDIEFKLTADGRGEIQSAEFKQFGVQLGSGHNLEQLAERTGILSLDGNAVFKLESDLVALRGILAHLSQVVYWSGRYPVPMRSGETYEPSRDIPAQAFSHYMRDWIDPVMDHFQGPHAPPSDLKKSFARIQAIVKSANDPHEA